MYLREKTGEQAPNEEKSNGNGGSVGHKIEEESEAAFDYRPQKIGDLCPAPQGAFFARCGDKVPFGQAAVVNDTCAARSAGERLPGQRAPECYACGYSEC